MTWSRKGNALHVKSAKSFNNRVLPLLVGPQGDQNLFRNIVSKHLIFQLQSHVKILTCNQVHMTY